MGERFIRSLERREGRGEERGKIEEERQEWRKGMGEETGRRMKKKIINKIVK